MCEVSKNATNKRKNIKAKVIAWSIKKDMAESSNKVLSSIANSIFYKVLEEIIQTLTLLCKREYTFSG